MLLRRLTGLGFRESVCVCLFLGNQCAWRAGKWGVRVLSRDSVDVQKLKLVPARGIS